MVRAKATNTNGKRLATQQSVNGAVKCICDIMRRSNCAGALQYVSELTWMLFRTTEYACVQTKRKLLDECDLGRVLSVPAGAFVNAGAGVKTNLLFFTKGGPPERIWYNDLSGVKVGKKTPITPARAPRIAFDPRCRSVKRGRSVEGRCGGASAILCCSNPRR